MTTPPQAGERAEALYYRRMRDKAWNLFVAQATSYMRRRNDLYEASMVWSRDNCAAIAALDSEESR